MTNASNPPLLEIWEIALPIPLRIDAIDNYVSMPAVLVTGGYCYAERAVFFPIAEVVVIAMCSLRLPTEGYSGRFNGRPHVQWPTRPQHNGPLEAPVL